MKISGSNSVPAGGAARAGGKPAAGGFSLNLAGPATGVAGAAPPSAAQGVSSLSALLTLQLVEDPLQRRRRAVSRAGRILDALDELKLALLEGGVSPVGLERLVRAVREERADTEDPRLQGLLNEIETRAAVELAKLGHAIAA